MNSMNRKNNCQGGVILLKSYEIIAEIDGKIDRIVVDAETKTEAKKLVKAMHPDKKVEFVMVKQVV